MKNLRHFLSISIQYNVKTTLGLIVLILLTFGVLSGCKSSSTYNGYTKEDLPDSKEAYQKMLSIKCFAFGGVGVAGVTSEGELCFRALASNTNRLSMFQSVLAKGTPEAQLYALCGIRQYAPEELLAAAAPIVKANNKVFELRGCIRMEEHTSEVVARIEGGSYDFYLKGVGFDKESRN